MPVLDLYLAIIEALQLIDRANKPGEQPSPTEIIFAAKRLAEAYRDVTIGALQRAAQLPDHGVNR